MRKWLSWSRPPGGVDPQACVLSVNYLKQTHSAKNRNLFKAGNKGVPFLLCSPEDLSKEDELPFVF